MNELFNLADKLRELREEKDAQAAILKDINGEIAAVERELSEEMTAAECTNFTRGDRQFVLTSTTRWSPETERKEELYETLKAKGYGHLFTINAQTLASFVREQVGETEDENGDTHIPDWLLGFVKSLLFLLMIIPIDLFVLQDLFQVILFCYVISHFQLLVPYFLFADFLLPPLIGHSLPAFPLDD